MLGFFMKDEQTSCVCSTRFIAHKTVDLGRLINRFGAYLSPLVALTEDITTRSVDGQKMKGCISMQRFSFMTCLMLFARLCKRMA